MATLSTAKLRGGGVAALALAAIVLAGCGSSSSSSTSTAAAATSAASSSASTSAAATSSTTEASGEQVATTKGAAGVYLTGDNGRALYLWAADTGGKSACSGACAHAWPPVETKGKPVAGAGVNASDLGTIARSDGSQQVTYKGHPLYYFIADKSAGAVKGQGSNSFGAKWWLVAPSGSALTTGGSSSGGSSSGGSSSSSSHSGGGWG